MRRRTGLAAVAAALVVGLTGCGIPDETEVRDIGAGPDPGYATGGGTGVGPPSRNAASTKEGFVTNFLAAAAGEPNPDKMQDRVRQYLQEPARERVKVDREAGLNVVHVMQPPTFTDAGQGLYKVTLKVKQVGLLNAQGWVGEPVLDRQTYTFTISGIDGSDTWYVTEPPPDLLLSTDALGQYYTPRTIYFWSEDRRTLVPDGRYMPNDLDEGQQPTRIVDWLEEGPSNWLEPAVNPLNDGSESNPNVPYPKDRLEVAFNAVAAEQTSNSRGVDVVAQLGQQLLWSLRAYDFVDLELRIDGQQPQVFAKDAAYYAANPAHRSLGGPSAEPEELPLERFAVYQGKVYRLASSPDGGKAPLPQLLLADGINDGLASAALAREVDAGGVRTAAALVTRQAGRFKLRVVSAVGDGAHPASESKAYATMTRPVWLKAPMKVGLVVADGNLYQFTLDSGELKRVDGLPSGFEGKITGVSAGPEGRRIALVVNGQVYVCGISRGEGETGDVEATEGAMAVPTTLRSISAVDWSDEAKIVVAGIETEGKHSVAEVSLDGAIEEEQVNDTGDVVTQLVAYPNDPLRAAVRTNIMYSRDGAAFDLEGTKQAIESGEVVGASGEVVPGQVTAPFFLLD